MHSKTNNKFIKDGSLTVFQFSLIIILTSAAVRLATSLYLPALIAIGKTLNMTKPELSSTVTVFLLTFAGTTLFIGPLADSIGRKKVIISGLVIFIAGSLLCGLSSSMAMLITGRALQAIGASCVPVASRAMIRDTCNDHQVISVMGWMVAIGGLTPVLAPILGGVITSDLGWRYNFWLLIAFAITATALIAKKLPTTLAPEHFQTLNISNISRLYMNLVESKKFVLVIMPLALTFAIQGAYLAASPFIFMHKFGLSPTEYGIANIAIVISLIAGRYIAIFIAAKASLFLAYLSGAFMTMLGALALSGMTWFHYIRLESFLGALMIAVTGFGVILPIAIKSIMTSFRHQAGTASALHGCLTMAAAAAGSFAITILQHTGLNPLEALAIFMAPAGIGVFVSSFFTNKHLI
jgi:DHA1 family bicyclomycin/chloramphenicol resistance-like MFS transporter